MNMRWNLDSLYIGFDSEDFIGDFNRVEKLVEEMSRWTKSNLLDSEFAQDKIESYLKMQIEFNNLFSKLIGFANLSLSVDAKNEKAMQYAEKLEAQLPKLTEPNVIFQKWLSKLENLDDLYEQSDFIKEHRFYLSELKNMSKFLLSDKEEVIIANMKNTGSNAWEKLQEMLSSMLLVDICIDGEEKKLPLPVIRNMAYDKNANVRKLAYEAELKAYKKIEESSAACLNGIKGEVITLCNLRGYKSPLEKTLIDSRMDFEMLNAMLEAIRESLPSFRKYFRRKGELLGHKNGLPFYDLFAPIGEVAMEFTYEEAKNYIVNNFRKFSDKLADYALFAFENGWIDAEPREGKRGGAFCSNLHAIKQSRILTNYTGSFSNVTTLAHELGHGYHGACLVNESILNSDYPMPIAETASIFCETIIINAALKDATVKERFAILENDISSAGQVIVDIYSRYLFESELFERRKGSSLSVNELKELMQKSQKEAYGDGLDSEWLHPYMWVCKPHYYSADYNYYNFPYAFGLLFAKGLYVEYINRGKSFVDEYDRLLSITGKNNLADIAKTIGIDLRNKEFWKSSLGIIEKDIEEFISL